MAKAPKKSRIGWKFEVEHHKVGGGSMREWWSVEGPLEGFVHCDSKEDAETIVAALNMATASMSIQRKAKALASELEAISNLFEE